MVNMLKSALRQATTLIWKLSTSVIVYSTTSLHILLFQMQKQTAKQLRRCCNLLPASAWLKWI